MGSLTPRQRRPARRRPAARSDDEGAAGPLAERLQESPRLQAQQRQTTALFGPSPAGPVQRKILIDGEPYAGDKASPAVKQAADDEFVRRYESEKEMSDHLDAKLPSSVGLIKSRALWYRLPLLTKQFFVFGESHAAVRGVLIKQASHIQAPILDERITGWKVGEPLAQTGKDEGADENASKLMRALEAWNPKAFTQRATGGGAPDTPPGIPPGESSTRDRRRGTYRLVVPGEDGQPAWWKPSSEQQAPTSTHDHDNEVLSAIRNLFVVVFENEIKHNTLNDVVPDTKTETAWLYMETSKWVGREDALVVQGKVREFLLAAVRAKASREYAWLPRTHRAHTRSDDRAGWSADDYRDEFMFVRILEAAATRTYAFATIGDQHLQALKGRLANHGISFVTMEDFFERHAQDAVDTRAIAHKIRVHRRLALWVAAALHRYPNLQQMHLDTLTPQDIGEFTLRGEVAKWQREDGPPTGGEHHRPVLLQFFRDLLHEYPNGQQYISSLTEAQVGEFLLDGEIEAWDAIGT